MEKYDLTWMNTQAKTDPAGFIASCEEHYQNQINAVAEQLILRQKTHPIVLLCGPSSSGKTTTADRLRRALHQKGVRVETISMDDYYLSRGEYQVPWDEENNVPDFESPLCMELPLLHDHLAKLAQGGEIAIPTFDFATKQRTKQVKTRSLSGEEMVVIEGIHAFNHVITGGLEQISTGVYISLNSEVDMDGWVLTSDQLRFYRRAVRDANFRGAPVDITIQQWKSVRRGERMYIDPVCHTAAYKIDSYIPYETCILCGILQNKLGQYEENLLAAGLQGAVQSLNRFAPIDYLPYIPESSVLHEFIG